MTDPDRQTVIPSDLDAARRLQEEIEGVVRDAFA